MFICIEINIWQDFEFFWMNIIQKFDSLLQMCYVNMSLMFVDYWVGWNVINEKGLYKVFRIYFFGFNLSKFKD